jgi:hypothetical protein
MLRPQILCSFQLSPQFGCHALGTITTGVGFRCRYLGGLAQLSEVALCPPLLFVEQFGVGRLEDVQFLDVQAALVGGIGPSYLKVAAEGG